MKKIFLIGDSTCFGANPELFGDGGSPGYGIFVREMLKDKAEVIVPKENARFAQYTLRYLHEWAVSAGDPKTVDVVHWNNGLWDVMGFDGEEPITPCDVYTRFLEKIYVRIRNLFPNAKIIFALTTSVVEELTPKGVFRYNKDIQKFNDEACKLMDKLGVKVNDLYKLSKEIGNDKHTDWVHFGHEGCKLLAQRVVENIEKV